MLNNSREIHRKSGFCFVAPFSIIDQNLPFISSKSNLISKISDKIVLTHSNDWFLIHWQFSRGCYNVSQGLRFSHICCCLQFGKTRQTIEDICKRCCDQNTLIIEEFLLIKMSLNKSYFIEIVIDRSWINSALTFLLTTFK